MSESIPEKGTLDYIKYKRKMANKKYQDRLKQKLEAVESLELNDKTPDEHDPPAEFFFQPKKPNLNKQTAQTIQKEPEIVLKMPETSITTQIKNQLIMGSLALIPMLFSTLYKIYDKKANNSSANQSANQSNQQLTDQQQLNFF